MAINLTLLTVMIIAALLTVLADSLLKSAIGLAVVSAAIAALLFRLNGPLAGVFELSVCAGLITAVFATTISLTKPANNEETATEGRRRLRKYWPLPLLMIAAGFVIWKFLKLPSYPALPFTLETSDVRHILWNVRHMDILGQIAIVLLGAFGVVVLFRGAKKTMMEARLFWIFSIFIGMLFVAGFYYVILTRNLIRVLIGIEILIKAVTLLIMLNGYLNRQIGLAQAMVLTVIIIEVFFVAVAAGIVLNIFRKTDSLDTRETARMRG